MNDPLYLKTALGTCICRYLSLKSNLRDTSTIQRLQSQKPISEIYGVFFTIIYINTIHLNCNVYILYYNILANIYFFRANNKALQKVVEYGQSQQSNVFIVNFEHT